MQRRNISRRTARNMLAAAVAWIAAGSGPAAAIDRNQTSRSLERSAALARERAASAASAAEAASAAAPPASAASGVDNRRLWSVAPAKPAASAASGPDISLTVGASNNRGSGGHTLTTPFTLALDQGDWHAELSGDGQTRRRGKTRVDGFADVSVLGAYNAVFHDLTVQPSLQWTFPSGAPAGSKRASQTAAVQFSQTLRGPWILYVTPSWSRNPDDDTGAVAHGRSVSTKLSWEPTEHLGASFAAARSHPGSDNPSTALTAEFHFPLCLKLDGDVTASRTLAGAASDNGMEFDLTWAF